MPPITDNPLTDNPPAPAGEALALREAYDQHITQALELRKTLLAERAELAQRVVDSAYNRIIHKEERDVVKAPTRPFRRTHDEFLTLLERVRALVTAIQRANHTVTVAFRDE